MRQTVKLSYNTEKLDKTILYVLYRAKRKGFQNLSKFELFKLLYLLEVESYRYTGKSFFDSTVCFVRDQNGPISVDIYQALSNMEGTYIRIEKKQKSDYPYERHCISLIKNQAKSSLLESEKLFINSILESYLTLPMNQLKDIVYQTKPMEEIQREEKKQKSGILKGHKLDFSSIPLDEDVVDLITGSNE